MLSSITCFGHSVFFFCHSYRKLILYKKLIQAKCFNVFQQKDTGPGVSSVCAPGDQTCNTLLKPQSYRSLEERKDRDVEDVDGVLPPLHLCRAMVDYPWKLKWLSNITFDREQNFKQVEFLGFV